MPQTLFQKVTRGTLFYLVVLGLIAAVSLFAISRTNATVETLLNFAIPLDEAHQQLYLDLKSAIEEAEVFSLGGDEAHRKEAEAALEQAQTSLRAFNEVVSNNAITSGELADLQRQQAVLVPAVQQQVTALIRAAAANDQPGIQAARADLHAVEAQFDALNEQIDEFADGAQVRPTTAQLEPQYNLIIAVLPAGFIILGLIKLLELGFLRTFFVRPIKDVSLFAGSVAAGNLDLTMPVTSNDEIGDLQQALNNMVSHLRGQQTALESRNAELQHGLDVQQRLLATVQQLSTPLLTLNDGVVMLPLIGYVDSQRAEAIMQTLLHGVSEQRARVVILDVTGLAEVDTRVGQLLLQAVRATELLGAQVLLVGVTAVLAQVIIAQGIDLGDLRTYRDVGAALRAAAGSAIWTNPNGASSNGFA